MSIGPKASDAITVLTTGSKNDTNSDSPPQKDEFKLRTLFNRKKGQSSKDTEDAVFIEFHMEHGKWQHKKLGQNKKDGPNDGDDLVMPLLQSTMTSRQRQERAETTRASVEREQRLQYEKMLEYRNRRDESSEAMPDEMDEVRWKKEHHQPLELAKQKRVRRQDEHVQNVQQREVDIQSTMSPNFEWRYVDDQPVQSKKEADAISTMTPNFEWNYPTGTDPNGKGILVRDPTPDKMVAYYKPRSLHGHIPETDDDDGSSRATEATVDLVRKRGNIGPSVSFKLGKDYITGNATSNSDWYHYEKLSSLKQTAYEAINKISPNFKWTYFKGGQEPVVEQASQGLIAESKLSAIVEPSLNDSASIITRWRYAEDEAVGESLREDARSGLASCTSGNVYHEAVPPRPKVRADGASGPRRVNGAESTLTANYEWKHPNRPVAKAVQVDRKFLADKPSTLSANYEWTYADRSGLGQQAGGAASNPMAYLELDYSDRTGRLNDDVDDDDDDNISWLTANFEWKHPDRPVPARSGPDNRAVDAQSTLSENFEWRYQDRPVPGRPGPERPGPKRQTVDAQSTLTENFEWRYQDRPVPGRPGPERPGPNRQAVDAQSTMSENFEWRYQDTPVPGSPGPEGRGPNRQAVDAQSTLTANFEWKYPDRPVPEKQQKKLVEATVSTLTSNFEWKYPDRPVPPPRIIEDTISILTANYEWKYPDRSANRSQKDAERKDRR